VAFAALVKVIEERSVPPKKARRRRRPERIELSKEQRAWIMAMIVKFAGSANGFEVRSRKIVYARMMALLKKKVRGMASEVMEELAGGTLGHAIRKSYIVKGRVVFNPAWDVATMHEVVKFRKHSFPMLEIKSPADVERHVLRHLDTVELTNRRMVRKYVLGRRHFARYYDSPEFLRALDASFRYTGSAYALQKAMNRKSNTRIPVIIPDIFFKKAGQQVRERKYSKWLRDHKDAFRDIEDSLMEAAQDEIKGIQSWSALERFSQDWHQRMERQAVCAIDDKGYSGTPFKTTTELPDRFERDGYIFTLLKTGKAMAAEGAEMRHCLSSYVWRAENGNYLAFAVEGNGERATLGLSRSGKKWVIDQMRGKRNAKVSGAIMKSCDGLICTLNDGEPCLEKAA
jgi:PcfJ-like protein